MGSTQKYTDEYLKDVFLNKAKELGRTPKRKEVPHGNVIATRFGDGSYDKAVMYFGLTPNFSKTNKKPKIEDKRLNLSCIETYELVLKGDLRQFPRFFWQDISEFELRELLKYFFGNKLKWNFEDIKESLDSSLFQKYKLGGGLFQDIFDGSPFKVVNFTYPDKIKEWELKCTPLSYWNMERCIEVTKYILEKEQWTDEDIKTKPIAPLFKKYGVTTIYRTFFNGNPYSIINALYPNKFKPWELLYTPKYYWNVETGIQAVKWMIEDKLKWTDEEIKKKYSLSTFKKFGLENMVNTIFECSPFKAINSTYPNKFTEEDFNNVPLNYWTKQRAIESIKNVLDELTDEEIKKNVSVKFFIENGLRYPFSVFFGGRPFLVLETLYPNRFKKEDFFIRNQDQL